MTLKDAKRELRPIKEMEKDIRSLELEIERLLTIATKMTAGYDTVTISGSPKNKVEEAIIQVEEYRSRLSAALLENVRYKIRCLEKVRKIEPASLQKVLILYYFQNNTMERTAELLEKSYQYTYTMFKKALGKYCKISDAS